MTFRLSCTAPSSSVSSMQGGGFGAKVRQGGFTIVELLVVIVVIAILAAITVTAYNGVTRSAQGSKIASDIATLQKVIMLAEQNTGKTLLEIAPSTPNCGTGGAATCCLNYGAWSTPPANCTAAWVNLLDNLSDASGVNVRNITDPWGHPYAIFQVERSTDCRHNEMFALEPPIIGWGTKRINYTELPFSAASGCV